MEGRSVGASAAAFTINNGNVRLWIVGAIGVLLFGMIVAGFDLWYQTFYYVSTEDAQVTGRFVQVGAPAPALVTSLNVQVGEQVIQGQSVATVQLSSPSPASAATGWTNVHLKAPRSGVIASVPAREGQLIPTGQPVVVLVNPEALWIVANVEETALRGVQIGQPAEVRFNMLDQVVFGRVGEILPEFTQPGQANGGKPRTSSQVPVRIDLDGGVEGLYPGMTAYVKIRIR